MKRSLVTFIMCFFGGVAYSQAVDTLPVYLRFPTIPPFTIYKAADSSAFTRDNLKKKKSTVFIIFSPDCEHCQQETDSLIAKINLFSKAQIVMNTYLSHEEMVKFYKAHKIASYPTITMGRDAAYFFPVFFKIESLPAIYIYDKKGKFKKAFQGSVSIEKIAQEL